MVVKVTNLRVAKPLFIDLQKGADEELSRQLFDGIADRVRSSGKAPVTYRLAPRCPRTGREKLRLCFEVKRFHGLHRLAAWGL